MIPVAVQQKLDQIKALSAQHAYEQALQLVGTLEQAKPVTLAVLNAKANVLMAMGRAGEAEACYTWVIQLHSVGQDELDALHNLWQIACVNHDPGWIEWARYEYSLCKSNVSPDDTCTAYLQQKHVEMLASERLITKNPDHPDKLMELGWVYWRMRQRPAAVVCFAAARRHSGDGYPREADYTSAIGCEANLRTLYEDLLSDKCSATILYMPTAVDGARCRALSQVIAAMGKQVYLVLPPIVCSDEKDLSDQVGMANDYPTPEIGPVGVREIQPVTRGFPGGVSHGSLADIFNRIYEELPNRYAPLLSSRRAILDLMELPALRHKVKLLTDYFSSSPFFEGLSAFGYLGDYSEYIGKIYGISVLNQISQSSTTALSVIIPTRNSAAPLRYTLRSCLEQDVSDYEILICDNSALNNNETKELVDEIGDARIRYIRPPRPLNLTRNFEYAFLQARGEFLFSMGSDDAITIGGLKTLMDVLKALPEYDVIQWDRIFYTWPEAIAHRAGLLQTERSYKKGSVRVSSFDGLGRLRSVLKNVYKVMSLPMLYINSGMRRRYFQTILQRTGQLWDGMSQDIYMGVVNCALNSTIPLIEYPITVAGLGGSSFGLRSSQGWKSKTDMDAEAQEYVHNTIGYSVPSRLECSVPNGHQDSANLYQSFLRVVQTGSNPAVTSDLNDWKWAFACMMHQNPKESLCHDSFVKRMREAANRHGPEFAKWFLEELLPYAYAPAKPPPPLNANGKSYTEGVNRDGGMQLSTERLGVTNVYEVCQLIDKIIKGEVNTGLGDPADRSERQPSAGLVIEIRREPSASPIVSVVVPCYRHAQYLPETIQSLVSQEVTDWECLIIDDGSPDETPAVTRNLIAKHAGRAIRLVEQQNRGVAEARNNGARQARGKYLLFLDADDRLEPGFLKESLAILEEHADVGFVYTDVHYFGAKDEIQTRKDFDPELFLRQNQASMTSLCRHEIFEKTDGFKSLLKSGLEDWEFWVAALDLGYKGRRLPKPLFGYRLHETGSRHSDLKADKDRYFAHLAQIILLHPRLYKPEERDWARMRLKKFPDLREALERSFGAVGQAIMSCSREELGIGQDEVVFINASPAEMISAVTQEAWAKLLAAVPGALLAVAPFAGHEAKEEQVAAFVAGLEKALAQHGVDDQRLVVFLKDLPTRADVRAFLKVGTVYLDVYPQSDPRGMGDALMAGLPAVSRQDRANCCRAEAVLLRDIKLGDLIANNDDEWVSKAKRLATDAAWRNEIGKRIAAAIKAEPRFFDHLW